MKLNAARAIAACLCLLASAGRADHALGQSAGEPRARKFDEFTTGIGNRWLRWARSSGEQDKDLKLRFERYARELRRAGARPYAITYSPRVNGWETHSRSIAGMRAGDLWSLTPYGFDWKQINTVNGGFREEATTELWIVPPGAHPPCPTPTVKPEDVAYCPFVRAGGSPFSPRPGGTVSFMAGVNVNDTKVRPTFVWQVSRGKIVGGQGTDTITVELPADAVGEVVAKVELHGYSLECPVEATAAVAKTTVGVSHFKFDEFGHIPSGDTKARLDNLAYTLDHDPTLQVHVVTYGGRVGPPGQAERRAEWLRDYLVNTRGLDAARIIMLDGGYRDELSGELWLSLRGAGAPPTRPTIDKSFVTVRGR